MRKSFRVRATALLLVFLPVSPSVAETQKSGSTCNRLNQVIVSSGHTATCTRSGKRLVWRNGFKSAFPKTTLGATPAPSSAPTISPETITSPTAKFSQPPALSSKFKDPIKDGMQKIVNGLNFPSMKIDHAPTFVVEPGNNGIYQNMIEAGFQDAIKAMIEISGKSPYESEIVLIGRSQAWLKSEMTTLCTTWNFTGDVAAAISLSPCTSSKRAGAIAINLPGVVTKKFLSADPSIDLTNYAVDFNTIQVIKNLAPHEYYHFWQGAIWPTGKNVPSWYMEGTAQIFSLLTRAKTDPRVESYQKVLDDWFTPEDIKWSQKVCLQSIAKVGYSMDLQCQYIQGMIPVEVLLVKYGGIDSLKKINELLATKSFEDAFQVVTKISIDDFYSEVDTYAATLGWKSGLEK
jgi:hypothetical protein